MRAIERAIRLVSGWGFCSSKATTSDIEGAICKELLLAIRDEREACADLMREMAGDVLKDDGGYVDAVVQALNDGADRIAARSDS